MDEDLKPKLETLETKDGLILARPASLQPGTADRESGNFLFCHTGPSMNTTLYDQDLLEVLPVSNRLLRIGDVVAFRVPGQQSITIHRVACLTPEGIRTRGDNNSSQDPYLVKPEEVHGHVVAAWRGSRRRKIYGGRAGQFQAAISRRLLAVYRPVASRLYPLYDGLASSGILHSLLPPPLRPRVVAFKNHGSSRIRLMLGRYLIGHYHHPSQQWHIRPPFRLLVDQTALPCQGILEWPKTVKQRSTPISPGQQIR